MKLRKIARKLWKSSPKDWAERIRGGTAGDERKPVTTERYVWCLSTGRAGTQTLAALGALADGVDARHEPKPSLYGLSKLAYELGDEERCRTILAEAVRTCRAPGAGWCAEIYLESSPQVTFLAPILREVFPGSRFVHVVRHPAAVVRSGMRRRWYDGNANDGWRITPRDGGARDSWEGFSLFEKNAWLWAETNRWIAGFMDGLPEGEGLVMRSEELFEARTEAIEGFFTTLGVKQPPRDEVEEVLGKKLNSQQAGDFPVMEEWSSEERTILNRHAGEQLGKYGYTLPLE